MAPHEVETATSAKGEASALAERRHRGSLAPEERQRLLLENLPEVHHIARRIHIRLPRHVPFDDLVHEGVVGLIDALGKYDAAKNVQFRSYARFRIRGAILDSLRELDWGSRHLRRQARRIEQARNDLALKLGRAPSELEIALQVGATLNDFRRLVQDIDCLRVEALEALPGLISSKEMLAGPPRYAAKDPFHVVVRAEITRALLRAIKTLAERERRALTLYYFEEHTMKEVGRILDINESRVSQIIAAALDRLRQRLEPHQDAHAQSVQ